MSLTRHGFVACAALILALTAEASRPAHASDAASLAFRGASPDGRYVAYEQYGVHDGSGAAYAIVEVADLETGELAVPRVVAGHREGDDRLLAAVRAEASTIAGAFFDSLDISADHAGWLLVRRPLTDLDSDRHRARFSPSPRLDGLRIDPYVIELEIEDAAPCSEQVIPWGTPKSVRVRLGHEETARDTVLFEGQSDAWCQGAPQDYGVAEIRLLPGPGRYLAVVLHVMPFGFEGHDGRFVVVGGSLP